MKALYELKEKLHEELEEIARKPDMSAGDLEAAHKLTDTIKNIDKICMLEEDGGYSNDGEWEADMRGTYGRGSSYDGRGRMRRGMDRDYSGKRDSRGRYSREGNREKMMEHVRMAIDTAPDEYKEEMKRFLRDLEG